MSDLFVSYASIDRPSVAPLVTLLESYGLETFWDRAIPPGQTWEAVLERELSAASLVLVVWTQASVVSEWVAIEASEAQDRQALIPVILDNVGQVPLRYRRIQAARLTDWNSSPRNQEFIALLKEIGRRLGRELGSAAEAEQPAVRQGALGKTKQPEPAADASPRVVLVTGVRTRPWQTAVERSLRDQDLEVFSLTQGYFSVLVFLFVPFLRRRETDRIYLALKDIRRSRGHVSVFADSIASYSVPMALLRHPDLELDNLILFRSILKADFPWHRVGHQVKGTIVNECTSRDSWPIIFTLFVLFTSPSGVFGFGHPRVVDRFHDLRHGGYAEPNYVQSYLAPILKGESVRMGTWSSQQPTSLLRLARIGRLIVIPLAIFGAWALVEWIVRVAAP